MPKPAYLLDTNIVSDLVRRPAGRIRDGNETEFRRVPGLVVENWLNEVAESASGKGVRE